MLYCIQATVVHHTTDANCVSWDKTVQVPTFYLDDRVQGIVSAEHAERIAREIICPVELEHESVTVNVTAVAI